MHIILSIAKRELTRLRSRFRGRARYVFLLIVLAAVGLAVLTYRASPSIGRGLYRIGVSPGGPHIQDGRFSLVEMDAATGQQQLDSRAIDAYIDGAQVVARNDDHSQYAVNALKQVLEKSELARIGEQPDITRTFPLRIQVNYLTSPDGTSTGGADNTDAAVAEELRKAQNGDTSIGSPGDKQIIIPSLTAPPNPFAQVILAFLFILPVFMVSVFFTSGFMDEKTNRRLIILLSAPLTPFQIIIGKMIPYVTFALAGVLVISWVTHGDPLLSLAIFTPAILFIFGIYLIVPMLYRTFKDTTFISMLATAMTTAYLIFPAMFSGLSEMAYMSPITLAVKMYRGEAFGIREYLFSTLPLTLIFAGALYVSTRVLNEEYLMGYRPIHRKLVDAIYLAINRKHTYLSILVLSLALIPLVYIVQLIVLAISSNVPTRLTIGGIPIAIAGMLVAAAMIEEVVKSSGIVALNEHGYVRGWRDTLALSFLSALGFLIGEKGLLLVSLGIVSQSGLSEALFNSGLLPLPLAAHFVFTFIVCALTTRLRVRYPLAILAATFVHSVYNYILLGGIR
ncbi:MAG: ABC transporter permease [Anaerolineae bacterium]